jgi:hypothetical protein
MPMGMLFGGGCAKLRALLLPIATPLLAIMALAAEDASGQTRSNPTLVVAAPSVFEAEAGSETPLEIRVMPEAVVPKQAIVLVRGLPPALALSGGRLFNSGIWALRINDLEGLTVAAPSTPGLKSQLSIAVVALDGSILAETKTSLVVIPQPKLTRNEPVAPLPAPPATTATAAVAPPAQQESILPSPKKTLSAEDMQSVEMLMSKGEQNIRGGQVNVARLFYKRAADIGWAPAAMALASTYDAIELDRIGTLGGAQPDAKLAKQWYQKALALGAPEAQQRLTRLGSR